MSYDVVIPLGPNDEDIVPLCINLCEDMYGMSGEFT